MHLFIHDAKGDSAIMEYLDGKLLIYHGHNLPIPALTNTFILNLLKVLLNTKISEASYPYLAAMNQRRDF